MLTRQRTVSLAYVHGGCSILSRHGSAKLIESAKVQIWEKKFYGLLSIKEMGEFRSLNTYKDMTCLKFGNLLIILRTLFFYDLRI